MTVSLRALRQRRLSPLAYRRITLLAVWALGFIIITGGLVRITGSGLGCPNWPTCSHGHVVPPWRYHQWVEFGNRVVTGAVSVAVILAVLGSMVRTPRRRDLSLLSWGLVLGVLAQIVLGGLAVQHQLAPPYVMGHFLLSMLLLWDAIALHHRATQPDGPADRDDRADPTGPARVVVTGEQVVMARLVQLTAGLVILLGTVVTSTGPHGGDPKAKRLSYSLHDVARLHGSAVVLFCALTVITLWSMVRGGAPASVIKRGEALLLVLIAQGGVGYLQYFTGVPAWLVGIHIALAASVWAATIRFTLVLYARPSPDPSVPPRLDDPEATGPEETGPATSGPGREALVASS
ncbi:MAG TPA: COX15/CtaA family protein [Acidimicrobiales bacterium]